MQIFDEPVFHRTDLAQHFIDYLQSPDSSSGLFLAAPRRTGKTTFIKEDLVPLLRDRGATVIYADLWEDKAINPATVIASAIRQAILDNDGAILKAAKSTGLSKFKVGGFEMDLGKIGAQDGESISRTLQNLAAMTKKPIVVVIDEAQHAQTTEAGRQTLFALKAARDAMKGGKGPGFRLIATGSNSDKLATLVSAKDQAFYMAPMEDLELLGLPYLQWVLQNSAAANKPSISALASGFEVCGHRPEPLKKVLRELTKSRALNPAELDSRFLELMGNNLRSVRDTFIQGLSGMAPLDAAVMRRMALTGNAFTPFDATALAHYGQLLQTYGATAPIAPSQSAVQTALERLRRDGLVWNAGRGLWFIEDTQHTAWINDALAQDSASRPMQPGNARKPRAAQKTKAVAHKKGALRRPRV